jgi:hypothetical protein
MDLIDRDELELDTEWSDYCDGYISYSQSQINGEPTVQAIPLDKVKQAREEIDDLDRYFDNDYFSSNSDAMFKCSDVLAILDKLIAESEEKE